MKIIYGGGEQFKVKLLSFRPEAECLKIWD